MAVAWPRTTRALLVPDEAYWIAAGIDLRHDGIEPEADPGAADVLVMPPRLPPALLGAVSELRLRMPDPQAARILAGPDLGGESTDPTSAERFRASLGGEEEADTEGDDHDHDHGDMMAVTGEPSDDGLIMENAELLVGPVSAALPTGLILSLTLDGDVACTVSLSSAVDVAAIPGDPLAPQSFRWATERIRAGQSQDPALVARRLAGVELERATGHVAWVARLLRLIGWLAAAEGVARAAAPLLISQRAFLAGSDRVELASSALLEDILGAVGQSRRLARRTEGLAPVTADTCRARGIGGPVARAAGLEEDARTDDPPYRELGFEPIVGGAADAMARIELRIQESIASLRLAAAALAAGALPPPDGEVEGPRGPLSSQGAGPMGEAAILPDGAAALVAVAEASAGGHELARALVAVASFDLSPWQVHR